MLSPNVLTPKSVSFKRVNPGDWEWEQEGKRTETNCLNRVLISIFGLVLSIFRYKHLMIWFSNLGCSALHKRGFAIPTSKGEKEQGKKKKPKKKEIKSHRLSFEHWLCCKTSQKLQRGLGMIHTRLLRREGCRNQHRAKTYGHWTGLGTSHPPQGSCHPQTHAHTEPGAEQKDAGTGEDVGEGRVFP